ncbi:YscW family type III secretion system pilotin [Vibrio splendidus]|uniref:YscW family type III secretion system pilotin n=1 Tax=Vibrio splendidus TaxID=29497 RepID=A0AB35N6E4_VIBSP|nr:YscW family type III secretion system pilotin [Vibrio splendidus]MDP2503825.1 YscW family type III secretion system pilotin [Vibrio splendidus]
MPLTTGLNRFDAMGNHNFVTDNLDEYLSPMKKNSYCLIFVALMLSGCATKNPVSNGFSSNLQGRLFGWITFTDYIAPVSTHLGVELCQVSDSQCITVLQQAYQGVQLPVQYSFVIAPIQAGNGDMKVRAILRSQGEIIAVKEEGYTFKQGSVHADLKLEAYNNY